ncbi:hypothetical protein ASZ78_016211 [Callipepla squamata]|uniref:G-protein coupled receptors family 2 profile 2 domain-containing protein n=5 Tax=Neognathae TaxID=8825 RepID=A0A226N892_CALSU|nr:hypothetical protein ASZ78_016211 [Callipepla squamata]
MDVTISQFILEEFDVNCSLLDLQETVLESFSISFLGFHGLYCNATTDQIGTCWPRASAGKLVERPCPEFFNGIKYNTTNTASSHDSRAAVSVGSIKAIGDPCLNVKIISHVVGDIAHPLGGFSGNAYRECLGNGTWASKINYSQCEPILDDKRKYALHYKIALIINYLGHCISVGALIVAFMLFLCLRSIRCLRNIIHWNLITTFILRNVMWFLLQMIDHNIHESNEPWCRCITTVYNYFVVTNFFWMFVEGCYLHTAIVMTYSTDKLRKWVFLFIGWCIPCPIIIAWAIGKLYYENEQCWFGKEPGKYIDYIYQGPVILVLLINFVFLFNIVRILMTKLRASTTSETIQYRKAVKATLVLLPLLGITYMLFFVNPGEDDISQIVFIYFNSFLQSFQDICIELAGMAQDLRMALPFWGGSWELQIDFSTTLLGFFVSVFYCFLNGEVCSGRNLPSQKITFDSAHSGEDILCPPDFGLWESAMLHCSLMFVSVGFGIVFDTEESLWRFMPGWIHALWKTDSAVITDTYGSMNYAIDFSVYYEEVLSEQSNNSSFIPPHRNNPFSEPV